MKNSIITILSLLLLCAVPFFIVNIIDKFMIADFEPVSENYQYPEIEKKDNLKEALVKAISESQADVKLGRSTSNGGIVTLEPLKLDSPTKSTSSNIISQSNSGFISQSLQFENQSNINTANISPQYNNEIKSHFTPGTTIPIVRNPVLSIIKKTLTDIGKEVGTVKMQFTDTKKGALPNELAQSKEDVSKLLALNLPKNQLFDLEPTFKEGTPGGSGGNKQIASSSKFAHRGTESSSLISKGEISTSGDIHTFDVDIEQGKFSDIKVAKAIINAKKPSEINKIVKTIINEKDTNQDHAETHSSPFKEGSYPQDTVLTQDLQSQGSKTEEILSPSNIQEQSSIIHGTLLTKATTPQTSNTQPLVNEKAQSGTSNIKTILLTSSTQSQDSKSQTSQTQELTPQAPMTSNNIPSQESKIQAILLTNESQPQGSNHQDLEHSSKESIAAKESEEEKLAKEIVEAQTQKEIKKSVDKVLGKEKDSQKEALEAIAPTKESKEELLAKEIIEAKTPKEINKSVDKILGKEKDAQKEALEAIAPTKESKEELLAKEIVEAKTPKEIKKSVDKILGKENDAQKEALEAIAPTKKPKEEKKGEKTPEKPVQFDDSMELIAKEEDKNKLLGSYNFDDAPISFGEEAGKEKDKILLAKTSDEAIELEQGKIKEKTESESIDYNLPVQKFYLELAEGGTKATGTTSKQLDYGSYSNLTKIDVGAKPFSFIKRLNDYYFLTHLNGDAFYERSSFNYTIPSSAGMLPLTTRPTYMGYYLSNYISIYNYVKLFTNMFDEDRELISELKMLELSPIFGEERFKLNSSNTIYIRDTSYNVLKLGTGLKYSMPEWGASLAGTFLYGIAFQYREDPNIFVTNKEYYEFSFRFVKSLLHSLSIGSEFISRKTKIELDEAWNIRNRSDELNLFVSYIGY